MNLAKWNYSYPLNISYWSLPAAVDVYFLLWIYETSVLVFNILSTAEDWMETGNSFKSYVADWLWE